MGLEEKVSLAVKVGELTLKSPLVIVSGVFGYGEEFQRIEGFNPEDVGAVVLKGITREPWPGNPPPRIVETAAGMLNSIGLQNIGIQNLIKNKLPLWENIDTKVVINVAGHSLEEYVDVARLAAAAERVDAIELNLSCPNVAQGGLAFGMDPAVVQEITARVRDVVEDRILWVKLTPNVPNIEPIALAASKGGASAVSLINTLRGMAIDVAKRKPILSNNIGGLSGPAIKPVALLKVAEVFKSFQANGVDIPIIGIGGVAGTSDVLEFMIAGASAVGIGTSLFYNPLLVQEINEELKAYLSGLYKQSKNEKDLLLQRVVGTLEWNEPGKR